MQVDGGFAPLCDGLGADHLILAGEVGGHAKPEVRGTDRHDGVEEMVVAVGCLNENLGLTVFHAHRLQLLESSFPIRLLHRQITVEGKILTAQSGGHEGQHDGGGPHQRHHLYAQTVRLAYHQMPRVGHTRHARIRQQSHIFPLQTGLQELLQIQRLVVLVEMKEGKVVDGSGDAQRLQETALGAHILHNIIIDFIDNLTVEGLEFLNWNT